MKKLRNPRLSFIKPVVCLVLLITAVTCIPAICGAAEKGIALFLSGRKSYYNAESQADYARAISFLNESKEVFSQLPEGFDRYYWLAQAEFVLAEIAETGGEKRVAAKHFTESGNLAKKAIEYNKKSSDALRILADTYMRLMSYNGALYMMSHGPKAMDLLKKSLSLDKKNFTAANSLATYYLNAPAIGGGSVDKGIQTLKAALQSKDEFDNFISYIWLAVAYQKKKDPATAKTYVHKALAIYPNSPWAKEILSQLESAN